MDTDLKVKCIDWTQEQKWYIFDWEGEGLVAFYEGYLTSNAKLSIENRAIKWMRDHIASHSHVKQIIKKDKVFYANRS